MSIKNSRKRMWVTVVLVAMVVSCFMGTGATAAEASGDFTLDIKSEPLLGNTEARKLRFDLEAITNLSLTLSGLQFRNSTILSIAGLSFSAFTLDTTLGAFDIQDSFIFAPNIIEVDDDPFMTVVSVSPDPGYITGLPLIFYLDELNLGSPLDLVGILQASLTEDIGFQKKIVEIGSTIAGISFNFDFLLANLGTTSAPDLEWGIIPSVSGQILNGAKYTASTHIGTRKGMECFGVCKPEERFYQGRLVEGLTLQEEEILIEDLVIGGVENDFQFTFELQTPEMMPEMKVNTTFPLGNFTINHQASFENIANLQPDRSLLSGSFDSDGLQFEVTLLDREGIFSYPIKQLETSFTIQGLGIEGLFFINSKIGGSLYLLKSTIPISDSLDLKGKVVYLGGKLYSFNFGMEHQIGGVNFYGSAKFRPSYLLLTNFGLSMEF